MKIFYKKHNIRKCTTKYYLFGVQVWNKKDKNAQYKCMMKELMTFFSYATDLTKIPRAKGPWGIMQQANTIFLKAVSDAFEKHGIRYAMWAGTLIGALRHKGFIPWDDDIDILVPDEDYRKIEAVIAEEFKNNPDVYTTNGDCIRIYYRGTSMQIDCFPFLVYQNYFEKTEDREKLKQKIKKYNKKCILHKKKQDAARTIKVSDKQIYQWMDTLLKPNPNETRKMLVSRIGMSGRPHIFDYDWVFPVKKMKFEEYDFYGPNKPEVLCYAHLGDYMKLPGNFQAHQDITARITPQSLEKMMDIVKDQKIKK